MTTRELRGMLTAVENQEMTIRELRAILFEVENQDEEITEAEILRMTFNK